MLSKNKRKSLHLRLPFPTVTLPAAPLPAALLPAAPLPAAPHPAAPHPAAPGDRRIDMAGAFRAGIA